MGLSDSGEDTLFISPNREYKANREIATAAWTFPGGKALELEKVKTPGKKTIEDIAEYLGVKPENTGKAVFYVDENDCLIFVLIRGDFEVNELKIKKHLRIRLLEFASDEKIKSAGAQPGYASPIGLDKTKVKIIVDRSAAETANLVVGANEEDYHFKNFNFERDLKDVDVVEIATVRAGDPCPVTGEPLIECRGIEVGNIFQLGTKYSLPMNCTYLDKNGKKHSMIMGCYGVGVERTMASVIEQSHDNYGPIWPTSIAPYHVHICAIDLKKEEVRGVAEKLYNELLDANVEVLFDDRGEKAGFMFNDADLIGIPIRVIISPKTLQAGNKAELKHRGSREVELVALDGLPKVLKKEIETALS